MHITVQYCILLCGVNVVHAENGSWGGGQRWVEMIAMGTKVVRPLLACLSYRLPKQVAGL